MSDVVTLQNKINPTMMKNGSRRFYKSDNISAVLSQIELWSLMEKFGSLSVFFLIYQKHAFTMKQNRISQRIIKGWRVKEVWKKMPETLVFQGGSWLQKPGYQLSHPEPDTGSLRSRSAVFQTDAPHKHQAVSVRYVLTGCHEFVPHASF